MPPILQTKALTKRFGGLTATKDLDFAVLKATYDEALKDSDLLVMPTTPMKATPLPPADAPRELVIQRALEVLPNTCPFDVTGHPAMNVPCGMSQGLPLGMMLIGRSGQDAMVLRAAHAFEQIRR